MIKYLALNKTAIANYHVLTPVLFSIYNFSPITATIKACMLITWIVFFLLKYMVFNG